MQVCKRNLLKRYHAAIRGNDRVAESVISRMGRHTRKVRKYRVIKLDNI